MSAGSWMDKNKWFLLGLAFLAVNTWGVLHYARPPAGKAMTSELVRFFPGDGDEIATNAVVAWEFSAPMATPEEINAWSERGPVRFKPAVDGRFRWTSAQRLEFRPAPGWAECTAYSATLALEPAGRAAPAPLTVAFHTPPLLWLAARQLNVTSERQVVLGLEFNSAVSRSDLAQRLIIQNEQGALLGWDCLGDVDAAQVLVQLKEPVVNDRLRFQLLKGLPGARGPLGLTETVAGEIKLTDVLAITDLHPESRSLEDGMIFFRTTLPIDLERAQAFVEVRPAVAFSLQGSPYYWHENEYALVGPFEPGRSYTVQFRAGMPAAEIATLPEDESWQLYFPDRPPALSFSAAGIYLSPQGAMQVPVESVNVPRFKVTVDQIYPNNLVQFALRTVDEYYYWSSMKYNLCRQVAEQDVSVTAPPSTVATTRLDLRKLLGAAPQGAYWLTVAADAPEYLSDQYLVVVSDIGVSAQVSAHDLLVWVNSLRTLAPGAGAEVKVYSRNNQELLAGLADSNGLVHFEADLTGDNAPFLVTVRQGDELTYLILEGTGVAWPGNTDGLPYLRAGYEACLFTDRGIYRPGETSRVEAVVRGVDNACPAPFPVELRVVRPDGKPRNTLPGMLSEFGRVSFDVAWADYDPVGRYDLALYTPSGSNQLGSTTVLVEEFVPPQIKVAITPPADRASPDAAPEFAVAADYLYGAPAAGNPVNATLRFVPRTFEPEQWPDYTFEDPDREFKPVTRDFGRRNLDAAGHAAFTAEVAATWRPASALEAIFEATVVEAGGRSVSAAGSCPVDVYPHYIGVAWGSEGAFVPVGTEKRVKLAVVTSDGQPAADVDTLEVEICAVTWATVLRKDSNGRYAYDSERQVQPIRHDRFTLRKGAAIFAFTPTQSGEQLIRFTDPATGVSAAQTFYAGASGQEWMPWSMETPDRVTMQLDKPAYLPGETAHLLLQAPFAGLALVTVLADRVLDYRVVLLEKNTAEVLLPVTTAYKPNVYCAVSLLRPARAEKNWSAHRAVGAIPLKVDMPETALGVAISAPGEIRPRTRLDIAVTVTNTVGAPVAAEVVVAAVDEGICLLTDFATPNPRDFFIGQRGLADWLYDLYALLMPEIADDLNATASAPGGSVGQLLKRRLNPVQARRFKPVALWSGVLRTDARGRATCSLDVPEFTGRLRLMAVAVARDRYGSAQQDVLVKRPLLVMTSLPRFLAPGDRCRMPVDVANNTGADGEALINVSVCGPLALGAPGAAQREDRLPLAAGARQTRYFDLLAPGDAGVATVVVQVALGAETFSEETELPVRPASAMSVRYGAGIVPPGGGADIVLPGGWLPGTAQYTLWASGLPVVSLGGGLDALLDYPYGCLEQTTSASFPLLYLQDLADQVRPGSMSPDQVQRYVMAGIYRVLSMQQDSGGFSFWPNTRDVYEWGSIYAAHFLVAAAQAGYEVPEARRAAALKYLRGLLARNTEPAGVTSPAWKRDMALRAYASYVLALAGQAEAGWLARLQEQQEHLGLDSRLHLVNALALAGHKRDALDQLSALGMAEGAAAEQQLSDTLASTARDTALLLSTWLDFDPDYPGIPALVKRLESLQRHGAWMTTQENAMALMALGKYCARLAVAARPFTARVSFPGRPAAVFDQKTGLHLTASDASLDQAAFTNEGPGTLYYGWSVEGVPLTAATPEADSQLRVRRSFLNAQGEPLATNVLRQGDLVVVEWELESASQVDNIVIEDLLPAGLEVENANLKTSALVPWAQQRATLAPRCVEQRDDRVLGFTGPFSGQGRYYYAARAVTPGAYVVPPLSAQCMYAPEIRSVHGRGELIVEK